MHSPAWMLLAALLVGCRASNDEATPGCDANATAFGGHCVPKVDACEGAQRALPGGGCTPVGVPSDGCGEGFVHDGAGGCLAVLPKEGCKDGLFAIPGETSCHRVADCGDGPWGSIPTPATTRFVDGAYAGGANDGSRERPFTTIQAAVDAARPDDTIAIAEGVYREDVTVKRPVKLWGRCPEKVTLEGVGTTTLANALSLRASAELHTLAIRGPGSGVAVLYTTAPTLLDRVWVHDTGERGLRIEGDADSPSPVLVQRSLFERNATSAMHAGGGALTVEQSAIRDGIIHPTYGIGAGILVVGEGEGRAPTTLVVKRTLIERTSTVGVGIVNSNATVEDCLVRHVIALPTAEAEAGPAFIVDTTKKSVMRPKLSLARVVIEQTEAGGMSVAGGTATLEHVTVRDILTSSADGTLGTGIQIIAGGDVTIERSSVTSFGMFGLVAYGSTVSLRGVYVADGRGSVGGSGGLGLLGVPETDSTRSNVTVLESLFARTRVAGIDVGGADGRIEDTEVRDTMAQVKGKIFGDGIAVTAFGEEAKGTLQQANVAVRRTVVRRSARAAANVAAAELTVSDSLLLCNGFDLEVDRSYGGTGATLFADFTLHDDGGNYCGCGGAIAICRANQSHLAPLPPQK